MDTTDPGNSRQCRGHWRIRGRRVGWEDRASASETKRSDHRPVACCPRGLPRRSGADSQASTGSEPRRDRPLRASAGVYVGLAGRAWLGLPPSGRTRRYTGGADVRGDRRQTRTRTGAGAIAKAAHLIRKLYEVPLPGPPGPEFPLPAKLTVTAISGGEGYSMIPDLCTVNVDIRLTPALDDPAAVALLHEAAARTDTRGRAPRPPVSKSPPGGRHMPCQTARRCAPHCSAGRPAQGSPRSPRSQDHPTSATISPGWASRLPPDSAWTTRACTAPTNASAYIPYPPSRPPTIRRCLPFCISPDLPSPLLSCPPHTVLTSPDPSPLTFRRLARRNDVSFLHEPGPYPTAPYPCPITS